MNEIIDLDETAGDSKFACNLHFAFGIDVLQAVCNSEKCMTGKEQVEYWLNLLHASFIALLFHLLLIILNVKILVQMSIFILSSHYHMMKPPIFATPSYLFWDFLQTFLLIVTPFYSGLEINPIVSPKKFPHAQNWPNISLRMTSVFLLP